MLFRIRYHMQKYKKKTLFCYRSNLAIQMFNLKQRFNLQSVHMVYFLLLRIYVTYYGWLCVILLISVPERYQYDRLQIYFYNTPRFNYSLLFKFNISIAFSVFLTLLGLVCVLKYSFIYRNVRNHLMSVIKPKIRKIY